jgi:hypothetical protein
MGERLESIFLVAGEYIFYRGASMEGKSSKGIEKKSYTYMFTQVHVYILEQHS